MGGKKAPADHRHDVNRWLRLTNLTKASDTAARMEVRSQCGALLAWACNCLTLFETSVRTRVCSSAHFLPVHVQEEIMDVEPGQGQVLTE
eukprot:3312082-Amphidinium_carterae.1